MKTLVFLLLSIATNVFAQPASCAAEKSLTGRDDIIHCEGWESSTWWQNGYLDTGRKNIPEAASGPDQTSLISSGCISGNCLRVRCRAFNDGGCGGALAHHWPIPGTQQEIYLRYYIRFSSNWSPENYDSSGSHIDTGGKWPGLADVRAPGDTVGQCGNGGAYADGINCWSGRMKYRNCTGSGGADICTASSAETTRVGWYWYVPPAVTNNNQMFGSWDNQSWGTGPDSPVGNGSCAAGPTNAGSTGSDSTSCGQGAAGLANGVWYYFEQHIRMNTAGVADGVAEAWVNGVLKYRKTNMKFREVGHDNLHVRTLWLDVHMGGEGVGPLVESYIELDQLVVATKRVGSFKSSGSFVSQPFDVQAN